MKTIIIFASTHHGNTQKVARAMAEAAGAALVDIMESPAPDLSGYDAVGLASGAYFGTLHQRIRDFAEQADFSPSQKVFLAATCGVGYRDYTSGVKKVLAQRGVTCLGSFQCRGFDTFGPFAKIGGIAKGHPNEKDLAKAREWAGRLKTDRG